MTTMRKVPGDRPLVGVSHCPVEVGPLARPPGRGPRLEVLRVRDTG
jgi:hypothetical protein